MIPVSGRMAAYCSPYIRQITGTGEGWPKVRVAGTTGAPRFVHGFLGFFAGRRFHVRSSRKEIDRVS